MEEIVDTHAHLSERKDDGLIPYAQKNGLRYTIDELLENMRGHHIRRGLLLSPPLKRGSPLPNTDVLRLCARSEKMLAPVVTVEPSIKEAKAALKLAEENWKDVKAFKIRLGYVKASAASKVFDSVYDFAESKRLPVMFHTGDTATSNGDLTSSHPLTLDRLANKRDELRIVLCHFGNPWFEDTAELIYKHSNVYADTSGLITGGAYREKHAEWVARKISEAVYFASGAEKIFFGTDYPVSKHSESLDLIRRLEIDEEDKARILSRNAIRVYNL